MGFAQASKLPMGVASHILLQAYSLPPTYFNYCRIPLARGAITLTEYNISNSRPTVWVSDLKFLRLFPEGINWLNNFPYQQIKSIEWDLLYNLWKQIPDVHGELPGFVGIILNVCLLMNELIEFLGIFGEAVAQNRIFFLLFLFRDFH
jgi:hypothetical protein